MEMTTLPLSIRTGTASVHTSGKLPGEIDVPILFRDLQHHEEAEFYLQLDSEAGRLLRPACRERAGEWMKYYFFSEDIARTGRLPGRLRLLWKPAAQEDDFRRADLTFKSVSKP